MTCHKKSLKKIFYLPLCCLLSLILTINTPSYANPTEAMLNFFAENGIYYYDPTGAIFMSNTICALSADGEGSNTLYSGDQVLNQSQLQQVENNKSIYEQAAEPYGIPWQIIATIHYMENGLARINSSNSGGGAFGITPNGSTGQYTDQNSSDEYFLAQAQHSASIIQNIIDHGNLDITTEDGIKTLFFHYNSGMFVSQDNDPKGDWNRGYQMYGDVAAASRGEGSPYVMNMADDARNPYSAEMSQYWLGEGQKNWSGRPGAFFVYQALGGTGICQGLVSGGMDANGVYQFMQEYVNLMRHGDCERSINYSACHIDGQLEAGANCVTFVKYFLARYTTLGNLSTLCDGYCVVSVLTNTYGLPGGNEPRPYAIFSDTSTSQWGHTGVVMGIDEEKDEIYIGQAALGQTLDYCLQPNKITYNLTEWRKKTSITYAYTDSILTF